MQIGIVSVAFLMLATGAIYLLVSNAEIAEATEKIDNNQTDSKESSGAFIETAFFAAVGGAYIPVGLWTIFGKHTSKTPYYLAIAGSSALIVLYVLSRTVDIPIVGQQDDIGFVDLLSKALQVAIIGASLYVIASIKREKKASLLV
jgi:hypothetical protein